MCQTIFRNTHFLLKKYQTSNGAMARFVDLILKLRKLLEREVYVLSYESNLNQAILNISEVMSERMQEMLRKWRLITNLNAIIIFMIYDKIKPI